MSWTDEFEQLLLTGTYELTFRGEFGDGWAELKRKVGERWLCEAEGYGEDLNEAMTDLFKQVDKMRKRG